MKKHRNVLILIILMVISIAYFMFINYSDIYNKDLIYNIKNKYNNNEEVDIKTIEKLKNKDIKKDDKSSNDYFVLGYYNYLKNDNEKANKYFKLTIKNLDKNTHEFAKIFSYKEIVKDEINKGNYDKGLEYAEEAFNSINVNKYNGYYKCIWDMSLNVVNNIKGNNIVIKYFEEVISDGVMNSKAKQFTYSKLTPLYYLDGNYAKSIKSALKVINGGNINTKSNYYKGKAIINLSIVYKSIGSYDKSIEVLKKLETIKIKDNNERAFINAYGAINIADINIKLGNYDEAINYLSKIDEDKNYFSVEDWRDNEIVMKLSLAEVDINVNKYDAAEKLINEAAVLISKDKNELYNSKEIYHKLLEGNLLEKRGYKDKAIATYEESLDLSKKRNDNEYIIKSYNYLISFYEKNRDYENQIRYLKEKVEYVDENSTAINKDSAGYVSEKHDHERVAMENIKKQHVYFIFTFSTCTALVIISILFRNVVHKNNHDALTDIYSRGYFNKKYKRYLRLNKKFSIIMFDIDNFKSLNDTYGHDFGDEVLITISKKLSGMLSNEGSIFRVGGEEFIVMINKKSKDEVYDIGEKIRTLVERITWDKDVIVTISMGIAHSNDGLENILKRADENLYISKETGKNKITA